MSSKWILKERKLLFKINYVVGDEVYKYLFAIDFVILIVTLNEPFEYFACLYVMVVNL